MIKFKPTTEELKAFRLKNPNFGISEASHEMVRQSMLEYLEAGGTAEPVLKFLLEEDMLSFNRFMIR